MRHALLVVLILALAVGTVMAARPLAFESEQIPGFLAYHLELGAAYHDGTLHVMTSSKNRRIMHTQLTDGPWTAPVKLAYQRSHAAPALASLGDNLHMVHYAGDFKLSHSIWDGRAWGEATGIPDMRCRRAPNLAACDGALHVAHLGKDNDSKAVWYGANAGWGWGHNLKLPEITSCGDVSMAGLGQTLHMAVIGSGDTIWHTSRTAWGEWTTPVQVPGAETRRGPSLVEANNRLYLFFSQGKIGRTKQAPVAYSVYESGQWSAPTTVEGFVCYGDLVAVTAPGLPDQIHLVLAAPNATTHLWTEMGVQLAPLAPVQLKH